MLLRTVLMPFIGGVLAGNVVTPREETGPNVSIISMTAAGSGCRAGTTNLEIRPGGKMDLAIPPIVVEVGPGYPSEVARKNCRISLSVKFNAGYMIGFSTDSVGGGMYLFLGENHTGTLKVTSGISGEGGLVTLEKKISGPFEGPYSSSLNSTGERVWTSCGDTSAILTANFEVRIAPVTASEDGVIFMPADTYDDAIRVNTGIEWRSCD